MFIKRDFDLTFDPAEYLESQTEHFARLVERPAIRPRFEKALEEIPALVEPAACYDSFPISEYLHDRVILENGVRIGGGPVVDVVHGAEEMIVGVCTIGPKVDARIKEYRENDQFTMMILDELASWATDQVRRQLYTFLQDEAKAHGWRTSSMLSPGESEWSVGDQTTLFKLVDAREIGVTLTDSCIMRPLKSLSLIVGTGSNEMGEEGLTNCEFCSIRDRCRYRLQRVGAHP